jgi:hypothetical protein
MTSLRKVEVLKSTNHLGACGHQKSITQSEIPTNNRLKSFKNSCKFWHQPQGVTNTKVHKQQYISLEIQFQIFKIFKNIKIIQYKMANIKLQ